MKTAMREDDETAKFGDSGETISRLSRICLTTVSGQQMRVPMSTRLRITVLRQGPLITLT